MPLLAAGLLFLGGLGQTAALALSGGREHHHNGTTATLDPRAFQIAVLSTRLDTIYLSGNPRKSRTADFGFNFRIHGGVWAPCPVTVTDPADCMVGSCVDNLLCPDGCGFTDGTLPTIRCTEEGKKFCSTAYLTIEEAATDPVTSYACASDQSEDFYKGFTTDLRVEDLTTSTSITASTTSDAATTRGSTQSSIPRSTDPPSGSPTPGPAAGSDAESNSSSAANNIGAIIGGVAGCIALICGFGLAAVLLLRRKRNAKAKSASASSSGSSVGDGVSFDGKPELEAVGRAAYERPELFGQSLSEMSSRGPAAYDTSSYRADNRPMTPVELPTNPRAGWV
ncbi:hypothetical protein F5144DRAFT_606288 [Chaetomium tenue]|uniref:Uncharacterized protein n=1 Tax=Chaetomium tenue TaxID=1854479 RepID=A0ACB7P2Q6_9PEZI|nr:hypothetical protein F5144DRAFT_606288 [Chaetomium globosum]